jgi:hypothetical protein
MGARRAYLLFAVTLASLSAAHAAAPSEAAQAEIAHLFSRLEKSGCDFNRNGSWYKAQDASAHLRKKYEYLLNKGMVATADDFIAKAASDSSSSGKPYLVRCANTEPVRSGDWFKSELTAFRKIKDQG